MATKAEVQAELDALKAEHERLKDTVVETARRYASDHGWCNVVEEALDEMGVRKVRNAKVTVEIHDVDAFLRMAEDLHGHEEVEDAVISLLDMDGDFAYHANVQMVAA